MGQPKFLIGTRGRAEQILLNRVGCEARKTPANGEVFFLDFYLYRTNQDLNMDFISWPPVPSEETCAFLIDIPRRNVVKSHARELAEEREISLKMRVEIVETLQAGIDEREGAPQRGSRGDSFRLVMPPGIMAMLTPDFGSRRRTILSTAPADGTSLKSIPSRAKSSRYRFPTSASKLPCGSMAIATERGGVGRNTENVSQMPRAVSATTIIVKITIRRLLIRSPFRMFMAPLVRSHMRVLRA
jgi:hypothetical protein